MSGSTSNTLRPRMADGELDQRWLRGDPRAFDEALYLLMCGTGVGFSVERQFTSRLPEVADRLIIDQGQPVIPTGKVPPHQDHGRTGGNPQQDAPGKIAAP